MGYRPAFVEAILVAMADNAEAWFKQGMSALPAWNDDGPDRDARHASALALIVRAAEAGHLAAMARLAGGLDRERGLDWAIALARLGEGGALVSALIDTLACPAARAKEILELARGGEPWAQVAVGRVYRLGTRFVGGERDGMLVATTPDGFGWLPASADPDREGLDFIERAAAAGWGPAKLDLARLHAGHDDTRARTLLEDLLRTEDALASKPRTIAMRLLAELYDRCDAPIAERMAVRTALSEADDAPSMMWLADRYRLGDGVAVDLATAREIYERAAATGRSGTADACRELGKMYEDGLGVAVDLDRARAWYERAAELGADAFSRDRLAKRFGLSWYARGSRAGKRRTPRRGK